MKDVLKILFAFITLGILIVVPIWVFNQLDWDCGGNIGCVYIKIIISIGSMLFSPFIVPFIIAEKTGYNPEEHTGIIVISGIIIAYIMTLTIALIHRSSEY